MQDFRIQAQGIKTTAFLHSSNEQPENATQKTISFTIASKGRKSRFKFNHRNSRSLYLTLQTAKQLTTIYVNRKSSMFMGWKTHSGQNGNTQIYKFSTQFPSKTLILFQKQTD